MYRFSALMLVVAILYRLLSYQTCLGAQYSKPNIVLIIADDLGWNDVGWRDKEMHTPTLNYLARHFGVILNQSYVNQLCSM